MAKKKKKKKQNKQWLLQLCGLVTFMLIGAISPAALMLLGIGLVPSYVAFFTDRAPKKSTAIAVLMFNLAGCMPYLMQAWNQGLRGSIAAGIGLISDPATIVVMYSGAMVGYGLSWLLSGVIQNALHMRLTQRLKSIQKKQDELVKNWGSELKAMSHSSGDDNDDSQQASSSAQDEEASPEKQSTAPEPLGA